MLAIILREEDRKTERRGRDWCEVARSQEMPGVTKAGMDKAGTESPLGLVGKHGLEELLGLEFWPLEM